MDRNVFRSSGPGDLRDNRFRAAVDAIPCLPNGFEARSKPFFCRTDKSERSRRQYWINSVPVHCESRVMRVIGKFDI